MNLDYVFSTCIRAATKSPGNFKKAMVYDRTKGGFFLFGRSPRTGEEAARFSWEVGIYPPQIAVLLVPYGVNMEALA